MCRFGKLEAGLRSLGSVRPLTSDVRIGTPGGRFQQVEEADLSEWEAALRHLKHYLKFCRSLAISVRKMHQQMPVQVPRATSVDPVRKGGV